MAIPISTDFDKNRPYFYRYQCITNCCCYDCNKKKHVLTQLLHFCLYLRSIVWSNINMKFLPPPFLSRDAKLQHLAVSKNSDWNNGQIPYFFRQWCYLQIKTEWKLYLLGASGLPTSKLTTFQRVLDFLKASGELNSLHIVSFSSTGIQLNAKHASL